MLTTCAKCFWVNSYASRVGYIWKPKMERRQVIYAGRVQGVGFRQAAVGAARGRAVSGYVRNLSNGTVEMVVEGTAEELDRLHQALAHRMSRFIVDVAVSVSASTGEFGPAHGLDIRL